MNKDNVLAVADAIEKHSIPDLGFNMSVFIQPTIIARCVDQSGHSCGTVACVAGTIRAMRTGQITFISAGEMDWTEEVAWLDLAGDVAEELFFAEGYLGQLYDEADDTDGVIGLEDFTAAQAVAVLRHLAETGEVDWSIAA